MEERQDGERARWWSLVNFLVLQMALAEEKEGWRRRRDGEEGGMEEKKEGWRRRRDRGKGGMEEKEKRWRRDGEEMEER